MKRHKAICQQSIFTFLYNIKETETDKFETKINTGTKSKNASKIQYNDLLNSIGADLLRGEHTGHSGFIQFFQW